MGILEVCVEAMNLTGNVDFTSPSYKLASFIHLVAALFLVRALRKPNKEEDSIF